MDVKEKLNHYIEHATEEELAVLEQIADGLLAKQQNEQLTYLAGITKAEISQHDNETFEMRMPLGPLVHNPLQIVHGGMTATLLDSTLGGAAMNSLPPHLTAVTSQLNIHYLRPGKGSFMRCIAKIVHKGKQLIVLEGEAFDDQERLLAKATATFFVIPRR